MDKEKRTTTWEFSFDKLGEKIKDVVENLGFDINGDNEGVDPKHASYAEPLGSTRHLVLDLSLSVGETTIGVLPEDSENVFEAEITYVGEIEYQVTGDADKVIMLKESNVGPTNFPRSKENKLRWDIRISPKVAVTLQANGGVGMTTMMLDGLQMDFIGLKGGVGKVEITLPRSETSLTAQLTSGVGALDLTVPADTSAHLNIKGGVGATTITLPPSAAVSISGRVGMGDINVPSDFETVHERRVMFNRKGVWQTTDFENAEKPVTINFKGGVGSLNVRTPEVV